MGTTGYQIGSTAVAGLLLFGTVAAAAVATFGVVLIVRRRRRARPACRAATTATISLPDPVEMRSSSS